jgi:membrane protein YqaA with SNARE-associated domain
MSTSLENALAAALAWFALPQFGLSTVFITAFVSATLLPMGSEPVVFGYVKLHPEQFWLTIAVATLGNTLGGAVDYWMGRGAQSAAAAMGAPGNKGGKRYLGWFERLGPKVLIFSWLPIVGDPLCAVAGWLRLAFWPCLAWIAIGKCLRYVTMTWLLMEIPDQFWKSLLP